MKYFNIKFKPLYSLVVGGILVLTASCNDEDKNLIDYTPGATIAINGASSAYVGDTEDYHIVTNDKELDYTWSIDAGASVTENSDNDAYVDVNFSEDGSYVLSVNNGGADGDKSITVLARQVSFASDSVFRMETIVNDTITIPLQIGGGFRGEVDYAYSLSGDMTEGVDFDVVADYESPISASAASMAEIKLVVYPDSDADADTLDLIVTLNSVTPDLAGEYFLTDTLDKVIKYSIANDLKVASLDTATVELTSEGVYHYPVSLSLPAGDDDVTVNYMITGTGVSDASSVNVPGELVFEKGDSEKNISISVSPSAFVADQTITISLTGVTSASSEASVNDELDEKELVIDVD